MMFPIFLALFGLLVAALAAGIAFREFTKKIAIVASGFVLAAMTAAMLIMFFLHISISQNYMYIPQLNMGLSFSINPISIVLLMMSSIVIFVSALISKDGGASLLTIIFEISALGLFASSNLLLFYIFWDIGVIAIFFIINVFGSAERKGAAFKFLVYSIAASSLLLAGILLIYSYLPIHSFNIQYIIQNSQSIPEFVQWLIFVFLAAAFIIKMPIFPFHSWIGGAYTEAPTGGSMLISGVLSKYGAYGLLLLFLMMPIAHQLAGYIAILAGFSAFYAIFVAIGQIDIKMMFAYLSMAEMAIITLGITSFTALGESGALYGMLAYGLGMALLFMIAGSVEYMFNSRNISIIKGIIENSVSTTYSFLIGAFSATGVPLTAGFIADLLIFIGAFEGFGFYGLIPLAAIVLIGAYLYFVASKSFLSSHKHTEAAFLIEKKVKVGYAILLFFIFFFGVFPFIFLNVI